MKQLYDTTLRCLSGIGFHKTASGAGWSQNTYRRCVTLTDPVTVEELVRIIEEFLDTLSQENRMIFVRRYWFDDSYAEIAEQTGFAEKNISVRLTRSRKQLREYLIRKEVLNDSEQMLLYKIAITRKNFQQEL